MATYADESLPNRDVLEVKLRKLECLFTWGLEKADIKDLDSIPQKLLDRVKFCPQRYHATYFNILAFVSHLTGETESALEYLRKAELALMEDKRDEVDFIVTFSNFAWIHYHLGNLDDAEVYLGKATNIFNDRGCSQQCSSSLPTVHGEKAWSFLRLGAAFYEQAKESFSKALEAEPDNVSFNVGYAVVLYRLEGLNKEREIRPEASKAVRQLQKALDLDPTNSEVMVLLALKLQRTKRYEARKLIKEALKLSADVPQVTRYVAKYFRAEGSLDESLEILQKAVELSPDSSFLHHQIGLCYKQQLIQMSEEQKRLRKRSPAAQRAAKVAECISHLSKAVELKPSNIYAKVNLAEIYGENRQLGEADKIFTSLLKDDSLSDLEKQHCHFCYGVFLLYRKRDEDGAISQFKTAYKMSIDSYERKQAGKKLKQIAEKRLNTSQRVREAFEILAFVCAEDKQDRQAAEYTRKAEHYSSGTTDLTEKFAKGMKLKR
ncbi:interferon-induced protein with tetratricopeptide repeats 9 [Chanos chanos]|uniref:Interferon-induced protein with tetratricopeptide repeats 9 n=1 Tax=Chanos chanos TaxID=29144 RepID=A0A6J2VI29_CHACN|nr:interferon-induced protein with tetratricopeptide repeats 5-like [Chanos chanos]